MIGIVVTAHGEMADGLIESASMIVGPIKKIRGVALREGESPETMSDEIREAVASLDEGEGVLILLDLFGGTPSNVCAALTRELNIEVISGVNLPMLLEVVLKRESLSLREFRDVAQKAGKKGIVSINEIVEKIKPP